MIEFWLTAGLMTVLVAAILGLAILRTRSRPDEATTNDVDLYRDQLNEIERDLARNVITAEEAEQMRVEISRRLLEADRRKKDSTKSTNSGGTMMAALIVIAVVFVAGAGLYLQLGAPAYPDLPLKDRLAQSAEYRATRPVQAVVEEQLGIVEPNPANDPAQLDLLKRLQDAMLERPNDVQGFEMLAQFQARLGHFRGAYQAEETVIRLKGDSATASDWADYADLLVLAAGGYVSPEAESAIQRALELDPTNGVATYYLGLMYAQTGRPDLAFAVWKPALDNSAADAPWRAPIEAQIEQAAADAGIKFTLPAEELRGPSQDDVAAASDMTDADRQDMIEGMVARLKDRLASEGGAAEEWAQLIRALGVLGRDDEAQQIVTEARGVFADHPASLDAIEAAASTLGAN